MLGRLVKRFGWPLGILAPGAALAQSGYLEASPDQMMGGWVMQAAMRFEDFRSRAFAILQQGPNVADAWAVAFKRLFTPANAADHPALTIVLALAVGIAMACCGIGLRHLLQNRDRGGHSPLKAALFRLLYDALGLVVGFAIAVVTTSTLLARPTPAAHFGTAFLWAVLIWGFTRCAINLMLRPDDASIRLIAVNDRAARRLSWLTGLATVIAIFYLKLIYVFVAYDLALPVAQFCALIVGLIVLGLLFAALVELAMALPSQRRWLAPIGFGILFTTWLSWFGAVVTLTFTIFDAVVDTLDIVWLILALDRLLGLALPQAGRADAAAGVVALGRRAVVIPAVQRSLLAIAGTITLIVLGRVWMVEVFGLLPAERWSVIARALTMGLGVAVAGYVLYQVLKTWSAAPVVPSFQASESELHPQSRLATVLPILSFGLLAASAAIAILITLSELGVNTAPLLAGAGIFGLALSFGSQSLVRDIVSGIFYMTDDAFRVGEYIESGRLKGTVEKIMVRSLRLRHQNGQIHTIPYGQLGSVTNYSRDWATLKFNLRLARQVDLELVRKTAKKVGEQLQEDEEFAGEFLEPLKLQGVADVVENAIICRFKLTVRPLKPSEIQREALKRLYNAFGEKGIAFAAHAVTVRSEDGTPALSAGAATMSSGNDIVLSDVERPIANTAS